MLRFRLRQESGFLYFSLGNERFSTLDQVSYRAETSGKWLITIEDNDRAKIGTAMSLDTALQASNSFAEIRWFTEEEEDGRGGTGAALPY
jgi:hypothetical protein